MIEMTIYGRGGQGGVTLAKLIATAWFDRGKFAQAFGVYAAERSGAPIQAYVRIDDAEITNTNQIRHPDHVIVLDPTLIGESILADAATGGCVILNAPKPASLWHAFRGRRIIAIDATGIAVRHGLGTRSVPIVNTTMFGAVARLFGFSFDELRGTFAHLGFGGANIEAAREAFENVTMAELEGEPLIVDRARNTSPIRDLFDPQTPPLIRTGSWATRRPERRTLTPPCNSVCPAGNDVQGFLAAAARGDYDRALAVLLETTPFPGVCGRVCPAPCMQSCNRIEFDEGVNVRDVERFIADNAHWPQPGGAGSPTRAERVAVVGSGPAGISAAYQLARRGYHVSLFEGSDELGGVLRNGIPDYRLPKEALDRELGFVLMHGINAYVDSYISAAALPDLAKSYDAVFIGTGLQSARSLDLGHAADGVVMQGIAFLDRVHRHDVTLNGKRVVVVGGGNTAIDAARSSLRLGASEVRIVYRRSRADMPAIADEIEAALEEGVILDELALPRKIDGHLLHCVRMIANGRGTPLIDSSSGFTVECDHVILALGQEADRSLAGQNGIWYGGDFDNNEGTVAAAIASGRRAAEAIDHSLAPREKPRVAATSDLRLHLFEHVPRAQAPAQPSDARRTNFSEVHAGIPDGIAEAKRCLSCGVCNSCDRCRDYCPEGVLMKVDGEYRFDYDYCKGCGVCAAECPRGVVVMAEI